MSVKQRIAHALAANAFGQAVTIATQLLLTPMFFRYWGPSLYGEWLILSSVPAYLTMTDMGVGSAAGNEMTMRAGAGDHAGAQKTYRGAHLVALFAGAASFLMGLALAFMAARWHTPHTTMITPEDAGLIIMVLSIGVGLSFQGGVISAGFRAAGRNALGISLANTSRLLEALTIGILLALGWGPLSLCASALAIKGLMQLIQHLWLRRICTWLHHPPVAADRTLVKRLIAPSLGFMAFPLGNALALQGPILIIGQIMGGPAVALFSATRTLARLPIQITNVFNSSVWPEMSRAHGAGDTPTLRSLHRGSWGLTLLLVAASSTLLLFLGPWIAKVWIGSKTHFEPLVLSLLILTTAFSAIWNASSVVLSAINAHAGLGIRYVLVNAICLAIAWVFTPTLGWWGMLPALVLAEVLLLAWVMPKVMSITNDTLMDFARKSIAQGALSLLQITKRCVQ